MREGALGDDDIQARSSPTQAGCERARGNDNKAPSPQRDSTMIFVKGWGSLPTAYNLARESPGRDLEEGIACATAGLRRRFAARVWRDGDHELVFINAPFYAIIAPSSRATAKTDQLDAPV